MHYLFEVTAKPGYTIEQYAQAWVRASELIQQAPAHRARGCTARLAMRAPRWQSPHGRARPRGMPLGPASLNRELCRRSLSPKRLLWRSVLSVSSRPPSGRCCRLIGSSRCLQGSMRVITHLGHASALGVRCRLSLILQRPPARTYSDVRGTSKPLIQRCTLRPHDHLLLSRDFM